MTPEQPTIQRRVWECLRDNGPMSARDVTRKLYLPDRDRTHPSQKASSALQKMCRKGQVRMIGKRPHPEYEAIGRPPKNMRGKAKGSLLALKAHSRANAIMFHARRGHHPRPIATTPLEQAWGWLPSFPALQEES